jgi:glycosyltransferase involved in cell wall biosynthesis
MHQTHDYVAETTEDVASRTPLISIIIPYYNQQLFIAETVLSAKHQTYPNVEIIVVDDGSPVPAEPYLRQTDGLRLFRTENQGCPATRNFGFAKSSGEYLIFLDGDDILLPGAIEAHLEALAQRPETGLSFGSSSAINDRGEQIRPAHVCRPRKDYFRMFLESNPICSPGAAMIPRRAFVEAGMFDERLRSQVDDLDLYLRLARKYRVTQHDFCVLGYRLHSSNVSKDQEKMLKGTLALLDQIEASDMLTPAERKHLRYGRRRWVHVFRPQNTLRYRLRRSYYKVRAMFDVPLRAYYNEIKASMRRGWQFHVDRLDQRGNIGQHPIMRK